MTEQSHPHDPVESPDPDEVDDEARRSREEHPSGRRARWLALPVVAAAALAVTVAVMPPASPETAGAGASGTTITTSPSSAAPAGSADPGASATPSATAPPESSDPSSKSASPSELPSPSPDATDGSDDAAPAAQPTALAFPAADIDMAVLPLTPTTNDLATQQLVPPLTLDAYWLTNFGGPGSASEDTTYIVGHSWDGKDAPFNRLSDEALVGTEFTLTTEEGELTYVVDSVTTHDKNTLKDSPIWDISPNRVVLISCYTEDPWGKNVVVSASPKVT